MSVRGLSGFTVRVRPRLPSLPEGLGDALWLFVLMRVGLGLFGLFVWAHVAIPGPCHFELARDGWRTIPPLADSGAEFPLVGIWQRWDACWYSKVATFGYESYENSVAFWPLMPILMRIVGRPLGADVALSGLIVAGVAYVAAATGLHRLVARDFSRPVARRTVLFVSIAPAAFFLFAPFTEALFLALSVWAIVAARERIWWLAAVAGLLASLARIQGVFLVLPIAWEAWRAWREGGMPSGGRASPSGGRASPSAGSVSPSAGSVSPSGGRPLPPATSVAATVAPLAGWLGFVGWSKLVLGRTPLDAQDVWGGREFHPPWEVVDASWRWILDHHDPVQAVNLALLILFALLLLVGLPRLPASYSLYAIPQLILIGTRIQPTPLTSTARYLEVLFPAFVVAALVARGWRRQGTWIVASLLLLGALLWLFVTGDFVA